MPPFRVGSAVEPRTLSNGSEFLRSLAKGGSVIRNPEAPGTGSLGGSRRGRDCRQMTVGWCSAASAACGCMRRERSMRWPRRSRRTPASNRGLPHAKARLLARNRQGRLERTNEAMPERLVAGRLGRLAGRDRRKVDGGQRMSAWSGGWGSTIRATGLRVSGCTARTCRASGVRPRGPAQSRPGSASPPWAASRGP